MDNKRINKKGHSELHQASITSTDKSSDGSGEERQMENNSRVSSSERNSHHNNGPRVFINYSSDDQDCSKSESIDDLKNRLDVLMNSLATLSAEKSRMEANFQADKRQMRLERDEYEKKIVDLREKLKNSQSNCYSEIEHVKYKLIMERHDREKEQADHAAMIKELQKLISDERRSKDQMEAQMKELKLQSSSKSQSRNQHLDGDGAKISGTKNKQKHGDSVAAQETPPLLMTLQSEIAQVKRQHRNALREEHKNAAAAEQQARTRAIFHEARVAGLEARLAELSNVVCEYDRLRQQDEIAIQNLKEQLQQMQNDDHRAQSVEELEQDPEQVINTMKKLFAYLSDMDNKLNSSSNINALLSALNLCDANQDFEYREKYESLQQEFEDFKNHAMTRLNNLAKSQGAIQQRNLHAEDLKEKDNNKVQLHLIKTHSKNLEERISVLNEELTKKEKELKAVVKSQRQVLQEEQIKYERSLAQKENEFRGRIASLEQQLLRQRERSLALLEEKDKEIHTLKASFHALLPRRNSMEEASNVPLENSGEPTKDLVSRLLTVDSTPMLYYAQELARREVHVSGLRKKTVELESILREKQREFFHTLESKDGEIKSLQGQITRLEACKSREGANLEYLKNVFLNYLTITDSSSKRHMLNAISMILKFTTEEMERVRRPSIPKK